MQADARPPHSQDAMQETADAIAGVLGKDCWAVLARLQASAYGLQQNPANLPSKNQAHLPPKAPATDLMDWWRQPAHAVAIIVKMHPAVDLAVRFFSALLCCGCVKGSHTPGSHDIHCCVCGVRQCCPRHR